MRVGALHLRRLELQVVLRDRGLSGDRPVVLVERKGSSERISALTAAAARLGAFAGQSLSQAKLLVPSLVSLVADPSRCRSALRALAEALLSLAPQVELAPPETLLLDASAAGLLKREEGGEDVSTAERRWGEAVLATVAEHGLLGAVAVADTPEAAGLVAAHEAPGASSLRVVAPGRALSVLGSIPIEVPLTLALPLEDLPREERPLWPAPGPLAPDFLRELGVRRLLDLALWPPAALVNRLGPGAEALLVYLRGGRPRPLRPYVPVEPLVERIGFEGRVESASGLLFSLRPLSERICSRLAGRGLVASRIALELETERPGVDLDEARTDWERAPERTTRLVLPLVRPTAQSRVLVELWREKLNGFQLPAPVIAVGLLIEQTARRLGQLELGERPRTGELLDSVLVRLRSRLGEGAVAGMREAPRWGPEALTCPAPFEPPAARDPGWSAVPRATGPPSVVAAPEVGDEDGVFADLPLRPTRLFHPELLEMERSREGSFPSAFFWRGRRHRVIACSMPERLSGDWWEPTGLREYVILVLGDGARVWAFRDESGGWWLHGVFD